MTLRVVGTWVPLNSQLSPFSRRQTPASIFRSSPCDSVASADPSPQVTEVKMESEITDTRGVDEAAPGSAWKSAGTAAAAIKTAAAALRRRERDIGGGRSGAFAEISSMPSRVLMARSSDEGRGTLRQM